MKSQVKNFEQVLVKNFSSAEQGLNFLGDRRFVAFFKFSLQRLVFGHGEVPVQEGTGVSRGGSDQPFQLPHALGYACTLYTPPSPPELFGPTPRVEICRGFLLCKFCRGFSWRIYLGTFLPQNSKRNNDKICEKSSGSKINMRAKSVLPRTNPTILKSQTLKGNFSLQTCHPNRASISNCKKGFWKRGNCVKFAFLALTFLWSCYLWRLFGHLCSSLMPETEPCCTQGSKNPAPLNPSKWPPQCGNLRKFFSKMRKLSKIVFLTSWMSNTVKQGVRKMSEIWPPIFCRPLTCRVHCRPPSALHSPRSNAAA